MKYPTMAILLDWATMWAFSRMVSRLTFFLIVFWTRSLPDSIPTAIALQPAAFHQL